jgi:hypothetical protein
MKQKKNSDNAIVLVFPVRIVQMLLAERVDRWIKVHNPLKKTLSLEAKENCQCNTEDLGDASRT